MRKYLLITICFGILVGCIVEEHIAVPPQLKIVVTSISGDLVEGATITLYENLDDYLDEKNLIVVKQTTQDGAYIFIELKEIVYHFSVKKENQSNQSDITFFKDSLKNGERKVINTVIR